MLAFRKNRRQSKEKIEGIGSQLIEACKRSPQNFNRIQTLVESCPEAVNFKDTNDRLPLHMACSNQAKLDLIQLLVQQSSDTIKRVTTKGLSPLHYACREQASLEVIQFLVQKWPDGIKQPTQNGWLPLHLACARQAQVAVVQFLVKQCSDSVKKTTMDGRLPLHFACANQAPPAVVRFLVQYNSQAIKVKDDNQWTPLHIACAYSQSLEVIRYLVQQWRDGLKEPGRLGRNPLHVACWERRPLLVIEFLVQESRKSLEQKDSKNYLPLHAACLAEAPINVIQFLIQQCPASALEIGHTPQDIGVACFNGRAPPPEFVDWLQRIVPVPKHNSVFVPPATTQECERPINQRSFEATRNSSIEFQVPPGASETRAHRSSSQEFPIRHSEMSQEIDIEEGALGQPVQTNNNQASEQEIWSAGERLHRACEAPQSLDDIRMLVEACPKAIEYKAYGLLSIHTACLNQAPLQIVEFLVQRFPQALEQRDEDGNIPIHLACYSSAPTESIHYLLQQWPESVDEKNVKGETPLDRAMHPFYDVPNPELISWLQSLSIPEPSSPIAPSIIHRPTQSPSPRPGAVMVNEPAIRPDSVMYRTLTGENVVSRRKSRGPSFTSPMGVDELRAAINNIRATQRASRTQLELTSSSNEFRKVENDASTPHPTPPRGGSHSNSPMSSQNVHAVRVRSPVLSGGRIKTPPRRPLISPPPQSHRRVPKVSRDMPPPLASDDQPLEHGLALPTGATSFYKAVLEELKTLERAASQNLHLQISAQPINGIPGPLQDEPLNREAANANITSASSFYRAAIEESQMIETQPSFQRSMPSLPEDTAARASQLRDIDVIQFRSDTQLLDCDDARKPPAIEDELKPPARDGLSSFYREAMVASAPGARSKALNTSSNGQEIVAGSFYRAAMQANEIPIEADPISQMQYGGNSGQSQIPPIEAASGASSFYIAAMHAAQNEASPVRIDHRAEDRLSIPGATTVNNEPAAHIDSAMYRTANRGGAASRPGVVMVNEPAARIDSAMYRTANRGGAASRPGVVMVDEPVVRPDSAMYRAAQGNLNARYDQYS